MATGEAIISRKRYAEELKTEAVQQVVELGHRVAEVANRLGITTHSLYAWKKQIGPESAEHNQRSTAEKEIQQPKRELKRVTEERGISKSAVYFTNQPDGGTP